VAIIDLDFFKRINDQFGHPAGDEALRTFGIGLFANIRTIDRLGRYGGEEFLLIMPGSTREQAVRTLDRLRLIISGLDWSAILGDMNLTMSAGVCTVHKEESVDAVLARADAALYRAKEAGRNRVVAM
jgi:diguanylate cyclase (GGDEF)-like protein